MPHTVDPSYEGVLAKIFEYLDENLAEKPSAPISAQSHLLRDLRLDSLQQFEMVSDLEDHYRITLSPEMFSHVETVGQVAQEVAKLVASEHGKA